MREAGTAVAGWQVMLMVEGKVVVVVALVAAALVAEVGELENCSGFGRQGIACICTEDNWLPDCLNTREGTLHSRNHLQ